LAIVESGPSGTGTTRFNCAAFSPIGLIAQHEAEQPTDDAWIGARAAD